MVVFDQSEAKKISSDLKVFGIFFFLKIDLTVFEKKKLKTFWIALNFFALQYMKNGIKVVP